MDFSIVLIFIHTYNVSEIPETLCVSIHIKAMEKSKCILFMCQVLHCQDISCYNKISCSVDIFLFCICTLFVLLCPDCPGFLPFVGTVQHTQHKHPCSLRDSNPQSQQAIGRRPSHKSARPMGSAFEPRNFQLVARRNTDYAIPAP